MEKKGRKSNKQVFHYTNPHWKEGLGNAAEKMFTAGRQRLELGFGNELPVPIKDLQLEAAIIGV